MKTKEKKTGIISRIKTSKYYEAAEAGFWRIWKNKTIWFWGLFISAGMATNFSQNESNSDPMTEGAVVDFFAKYWQWLIAGLILVIILSLLAWIFSAIARAGVIQELNKKQNNKKYVLSFKKVWQVGLKDFKKVFGLDLFMLGILFLAFLVNLIMVIPFFLLENKIIPGVIMFVTIFASLLLLFGMTILKPFAQIILLLGNLSAKESFLRGWKIVRNNFKELLKLILTFIAIGFVGGMIFGLMGLLFGIPAFILYQILLGTEVISFALGIFSFVLIVVLIFLCLTVRAFFALWKMDILVWWVKEIDGAKAEKKIEEIKIKEEIVVPKKVTVGA